jgi:putative DNA primase/helicase
LEFLAAMEAAGITPVEAIAHRLGSEIIRFRCMGDGEGRQNGWAVLHLDGSHAVGAFGNHRMGLSVRWRAGATAPLSASNRQELAQRQAQLRDERLAEKLRCQEAAAADCRTLWQHAGPVKPWHPYLCRKGLIGEGLKQTADWLLVPMYDAQGVLWNVQRIDEHRKRFAKGARTDGLFFVLGQPGDTICIAEGYGTGAVLRRASRHAVAIAFSASNLLATARAIRQGHPDADIVLCADDDAHLVANPQIGRNMGLEAAVHAAQAIGGRVALPPRQGRLS